MIKSGKTYTCHDSSLLVEVLNVLSFPKYMKVKIALFTKSGIQVETPRYYKIPHGRIDHWIEVK